MRGARTGSRARRQGTATLRRGPRAGRELHSVERQLRGDVEHRVERELAEAVGVEADLHTVAFARWNSEASRSSSLPPAIFFSSCSTEISSWRDVPVLRPLSSTVKRSPIR